MRIRVGHLYPEYLNIYADRGNIAVLTRRAALRGHELAVAAISVEDEVNAGSHDLFYIGGGQDREQALIAPDLAAKAGMLLLAHARGVALLAVCGGYQLLGRGYRGRDGSFMPGAGVFSHETVAGDVRMIGGVPQLAQLAEAAPHFAFILRMAGQGHQPAHTQAVTAAQRVEEGRELLRGQAVFALLGGSLHLHQYVDRAAFVVQPSLQCLGQVQAVQRLHLAGQTRDVLGLAFAACLNAPIPEKPQFGVFRM